MTLAARVVAQDVDPLTPVGSPAGFDRIGDGHVDGIIWRRPLPAGFQDWIDKLPAGSLPSARMVFSTPSIDTFVSRIVEHSDMPVCAHRQWFIDDVTMIASAFAHTMSTPFVRLRFDVISDDGCRKFHRDAVSARLLCTYRGLGAQYGVTHDGDAPRSIFTVPTGAPIILKGKRWPSQAEGGALRHRSPPIKGSHTPRLVLALDPLSAPPNDDEYDILMR